MKNQTRKAVAIAVIALSACTPKVVSQEMTPTYSSLQPIGKNAALTSGISIGQVTISLKAGGDKALVSSKDLTEALQSSLALNGYYAPSTGHYALDAQLVDVDADSFGITMNTTSTVLYTLRETRSGVPVFQSSIAQKGSSGWSDSISGQFRSHDSVARSLQATIVVLLGQLANAPLKPLPATVNVAPPSPETSAPPVAAPDAYPQTKRR